MTWQFELTAEKLPDLQRALEWALQRQNRRFAEIVPMRTRQRLVVGLCALGFALIALLYVVSPVAFRRSAGLFIAFGTVSAVALVAALYMQRIRAWSRSVAGRSLERTAARMYRKVATKVPYTIDYALESAQLTAHVAKLALVRKTPLGRAKLAIATPHAVFLFRRKHALVPFRMIYTDDVPALVTALVANGIVCEQVQAASEGYTPVVPEARVH